MIDKNGKLFGKVNIIDLLIVLVVIASVIALIFRPPTNVEDKPEPVLQQVRITFHADLVPDYVPDSLEIGTPVLDYLQANASLGTLVSYETEQAYTFGYNTDTDELFKIPVNGQVTCDFVSEAWGEYDSRGFTSSDTTYVVGGSYMMNVGVTRINCQIKDFELLD